MATPASDFHYRTAPASDREEHTCLVAFSYGQGYYLTNGKQESLYKDVKGNPGAFLLPRSKAKMIALQEQAHDRNSGKRIIMYDRSERRIYRIEDLL